MKRIASAADQLRPRRRGLVILIYHRFGGESGSEIDIDPAIFADQLAELGPRVVPLGDGLAALQELPAGHDPVAITIDDGSADVLEHAVPALVAAKATATLYLATSFVESTRALPYGGRALSWAALRDAISTGALKVGSHTHAHVLLDRLPAADAAVDIDRSIGLIEDHLGVEPVDFAYPKAVAPSPEVDRLIRARFRSAALAGTRPNRYGATDPWRLARSPVQVSDGMRWFRAKANGGMSVEDVLRRGINRWRYARSSS